MPDDRPTEETLAGEPGSGTEIARAADVLPGAIVLLPNPARPFVPGQVLPVGGIREKVVAARRARIEEIILPETNRGDYAELPEAVSAGMQVHFVSAYPEVAAIIC